MRGQQDCRHLGRESLAAGSILWLLFRSGKGVAQREHLSQSSIQGRPAPEAGMGWLRTSTAPPEAPRPHTTIPDSPKKRSVGDRNRSVRSGAISNPVPPMYCYSLFPVRLKALRPLAASHWRAPLKLQMHRNLWIPGFPPCLSYPRTSLQHCVGWSKTAGRFQGASMEFSGLQSSCEVKEIMVRKGIYPEHTCAQVLFKI